MKQNKVSDESGVKIAKRRAVSSNWLSLKSSLDKEKSSKVVKKKIFTKKPASKQAPKFWFDGVEPELLGEKTDSSDSVFVKSRSFSGMTKVRSSNLDFYNHLTLSRQLLWIAKWSVLANLAKVLS